MVVALVAGKVVQEICLTNYLKKKIGVHRMVLQCSSYRLRSGSKIMPYVENRTLT
jgi:hypothetical protein